APWRGESGDIARRHRRGRPPHRHRDGAGDRSVPIERRRPRARHVRLQAGVVMSDDVAIVGIGMHPFGRHPASGLEQGAHAARAALQDAGAEWSQVEYAFGGSAAAGNADTLVSHLGLTGLPFINVANGCATGGSALISAYNAIRAGSADVVMAIGF